LDVREFSGGDELKEFIKIKRNRRENGWKLWGQFNTYSLLINGDIFLNNQGSAGSVLSPLWGSLYPTPAFKRSPTEQHRAMGPWSASQERPCFPYQETPGWRPQEVLLQAFLVWSPMYSQHLAQSLYSVHVHYVLVTITKSAYQAFLDSNSGTLPFTHHYSIKAQNLKLAIQTVVLCSEPYFGSCWLL
jgi:hypothetical protein